MWLLLMCLAQCDSQACLRFVSELCLIYNFLTGGSINLSGGLITSLSLLLLLRQGLM
jgi:hypothetical protein